MKKAGKNKRLVIAAGALLLVAATGTLLARYISSNQQRAEMLSSDFRISSNYLTEDGATYNVTDTGNGVQFSLFNYEKENVALVSSEPIQYTVKADGWLVTVKSGDVVQQANNGVYTIAADGRQTHTILLSGGAGNEVEVTVKTTSPYVTELSATFHLIGKTQPDYQVDDAGTYVVVTIHSNDYSGAVKVKWTEDFSPDNTNPVMAGWKDSAVPGNMTVTAHTTYTLIFVKNNTNDAYNKNTTYGTEIIIGEE